MRKPKVKTALKRCNRCLELKPLLDFCVNAAAKDGRNYQCRACVLPVTRRHSRIRHDQNALLKQMADNAFGPFFTVGEVAEKLRICTKTVVRHAAGLGVGVKVGKQWRFKPSDISRMIESNF